MRSMRKHNGIYAVLRRSCFAGAAFLATMALAGCGPALPNLSDGQMDQVGEYAATLLLKYDSNHRMRLMSEEEMRAEEEKRAAWDVRYPVEDSTEISRDPQEPGGQDPKESVETQTAQNGKLEDLFELPSGVGISCTGYFVRESYSDIDATEGREILALQFVLQNDTDATQSIDFLNQDITYRIVVNSDYARSQMLTMLDDDLATYQGKLASGESQELVLLTEIEKGMEINSLTVRGQNAAVESTIMIK